MRTHSSFFAALGLLLAGCSPGTSMHDLDPVPPDLVQMPPDYLMVDMAMPPPPDMAMPPPDMAMPPPDIAMPLPDMAMPPPPPDMAMPPPHPDMAMPSPDLVMQDFTVPPDVAGPDLACPMFCSSPPAASCSANQIISYSQNGTCMNGTCMYMQMMTNCVFGCYKGSCTAALSFIGNTSAYQTGNATPVGLVNGTAPSTNSVTGATQTFPRGAAREVHLIYSNDPGFKMQVDLPMMADPMNPPNANNDQWFAVIPKQPQGMKVYWYVRADPYSGNALYDSGNGQNFSYTSQ